MTETERQNGRPAKPKGPSRPFRSAFIFYGGLAIVGFLFLVLVTGQETGRAAIGAAAAFVLATGWTWWRMWKDQKREARREEGA
jgi:hypothetical protein